jgi:hypothetical protein
MVFVVLFSSLFKIKCCFPYISAPGALIFKTFVSTPHNTPLIMGERHKDFEDPSTCGQDIRKTKFEVFFVNTI